MVNGFRGQGYHFCSCAQPAVTVWAFLAHSKLLLQRPSSLLKSASIAPALSPSGSQVCPGSPTTCSGSSQLSAV